MIDAWLAQLTGTDIVELTLALAAVLGAFFGWLSAREARRMSTRPLQSAERLMKATEQVNARTASAMDALALALTTHLSEIRSATTGHTARLNEIVRLVSRRRK